MAQYKRIRVMLSSRTDTDSGTSEDTLCNWPSDTGEGALLARRAEGRRKIVRAILDHLVT
jgi:hypothetical protein